MNLNALKPAEHAAIGRDRDIGKIVERVSKYLAAFFFDADNQHRETGDLDRFADGIDQGKELLPKLVADHDHRGSRCDIVWLNESPIRDGLVLDLGHVGRHAVDVRAEKLFAILLEINVP